VGVKVEGGTGVQDHVMFRPVMFGGPCNGDRTVGYEWMAGPQRDASCKRNVYNLTHDTSLQSQRAVHKHIAHYFHEFSFTCEVLHEDSRSRASRNYNLK